MKSFDVSKLSEFFFQSFQMANGANQMETNQNFCLQDSIIAKIGKTRELERPLGELQNSMFWFFRKQKSHAILDFKVLSAFKSSSNRVQIEFQIEWTANRTANRETIGPEKDRKRLRNGWRSGHLQTLENPKDHHAGSVASLSFGICCSSSVWIVRFNRVVLPDSHRHTFEQLCHDRGYLVTQDELDQTLRNSRNSSATSPANGTRLAVIWSCWLHTTMTQQVSLSVCISKSCKRISSDTVSSC